MRLHRGWSLWSDLCLRGAGFPAQGVLALAADEAAGLLDEVLKIEAEIERLGSRIISSLQRAISDAAPDARKPLRKALKTIWSPATSSGTP